MMNEREYRLYEDEESGIEMFSRQLELDARRYDSVFTEEDEVRLR